MSRTVRNKARVLPNDPEGSPADEPRELAATVVADSELTGLDDLADEFDEAEEDTDLESAEGDAPAEAEAPAEDDFASGPDDALGLYLRQMGATPLLTRD